MTKDYPWGKGTPKWVRDATANDSDKSFTVPDGKIWQLLTVEGTLVCTASVGNRNLLIRITNGTDTILNGTLSANIAASQVGDIRLTAGPGWVNGTNTPFGLTNVAPNIGLQNVTGPLFLTSGYVIRIFDASAIDAAADDLTVVLQYIEYDA